jgi:hypothetical protein
VTLELEERNKDLAFQGALIKDVVVMGTKIGFLLVASNNTLLNFTAKDNTSSGMEIVWNDN